LVIFGVGTVLLFLNYDYYRHLEHGIMNTITNQLSDSFQWIRDVVDRLVAETTEISILHFAAKLIAWPLPLSHALIAEGHYVLTILVLIGVVTAITEGGTWIFRRIFQEDPIDESIPAIMTINQMTVHFPNDTVENGIVIGLKGEKPDDFEMENATLHVIGDEFWSTLSTMYGATEIEAFRKTNYPFKLFPNKLSKKHFHAIQKLPSGPTTAQNDTSGGKQMWFHIGTGLLKEPAFSQSNIRSTLRKLVSKGDPDFTIRAVYSSRRMNPKKGILFEFDIRPGLVLNSIREGFQLRPIISDW